MFWHSIGKTLSLFTYRDMWLAIALFAVLRMAVYLTTARLGQGSSGSWILVKMFVLLPLLEIAVQLVVLWSLLPMILGLRSDAAWSFPWQFAAAFPVRFVLTVGLVLIGSVLASMAPVVGQAQTFVSFITGSLILAIGVQHFGHIDPRLKELQVDLFPPFWTFVGMFLACVALSFVGMIAVVSLCGSAAAIGSRRSSSVFADSESTGPLGALSGVTAFGLIGFLGLLPAIMYGSWVGLRLNTAEPTSVTTAPGPRALSAAPKLQLLAERVRNEVGHALKGAYRAGDNGEVTVSYTLVAEGANGLLLRIRPPPGTIVTVDPKTGESTRDPRVVELTIRDHDADGAADDFRIGTEDMSLLPGKRTTDGFVKVGDFDEHKMFQLIYAFCIDNAVEAAESKQR